MTEFIIDLFIGVLFAAFLIFSFRKLTLGGLKIFFSRTLIVAALIYVGFVIYGLLYGLADFGWLFIELGGVLIYGVFAYLGMKKSALFLAIGWAAHVFWDVALHFGDKADFVPDFYPTACIGFDLVFAAFIFYRFFVAERNYYA